MPSKKLLEIIKVLSNDQQRRLRLFLASHYFNHGVNAERLVQFFSIIVKCHADENDPRLNRKDISKKFFPDKPYQENSKNPIDSLSSELLKLVKRFITLEDPDFKATFTAQEHLSLARFYMRHGLIDRFGQHVESWRKVMADFPYQDSNYFLYFFYMEWEVAGFKSQFNTYNEDANLLAAHHYLDSFYLLNKLEMSAAIIFQHLLSNPDLSELHQKNPTIFSDLLQIPDDSQPLRTLYQQVIYLLVHPDDSIEFQKFEQNLIQNESKIPHFKYRNLMAYFRNFASRQFMLQPNEAGRLAQLFHLYKSHYQAGYLFVEESKILPGTLKSLINLALKVGETDWAQQILEELDTTRITGTKYPDEAHRLCLAEIKFYRKDFSAANNLLVYRLFENAHFSILVDVLQIKIYVETDDLLLESRIIALRQKIRRASIAAEYKRIYLNFCKIVEQIDQLRFSSTPTKQARLSEEIQQSSALIERDWLLQVQINKKRR